jgi:hypothetical protein
MANLTLSHPAEPRFTVLSETTILVAASVVAWFAIVAVLGARGGFVTPSGAPPLPIGYRGRSGNSCWRSTLA